MKNKFEQHIKQSLENFEAEYNPADWADMQNRLNKAKAGKSSSIGKALLIAASVLVTAGAIYYFSSADKVNNVTADKALSQNKNVVVKDADETPVQQPAVKDGQSPIEPAVKNDAEKENAPAITAVSEQKPVSSEKSEAEVVANKPENKVPVQEQAQAPVEQSATPAALTAGFRSDMNKVCEGAQVQFFADKNDVACTYKWAFGDGETSEEQNPKHTFTEAGTYNVKLRVTSAKDKKLAEQKNSIIVIAAPSVQMSYSPSEDNNFLINFEADGDKVTDWKWNFGDKQTASVQNPSHTYGRKGIYKVSVTAKNSSGCSAVVVKEVNLKLDLLAPTAFTPDGNGVNDTWMPVALLNGDYNFTLTIADKAGVIKFSTKDKNHPWDGQNARVGDTFEWRVIIKEKNGEESNYQGLITISE